jgi:hypothetical protein
MAQAVSRRFDPRSCYVEFVADKVALGQAITKVRVIEVLLRG